MLTERKQLNEPRNVQFIYWFELILNNFKSIFNFNIKIKFSSPYPPTYSKNKYSYNIFIKFFKL